MSCQRTMFFLLFLALPLAAVAETVQEEGLLYWDDLTAEAFPEASERIVEMMQPGAVHGNVGSVRSNRVLGQLAAIQEQLDRPHRDPTRQDLRLRRHLKSINEILATSQTSQRSEMVCRRDRRLGSNISETYCMSRAEIERRAQQDRESMQRGGPCDPDLGIACSAR